MPVHNRLYPQIKAKNRPVCFIEPLEQRALLSAVVLTVTDLGTLGGATSNGQAVNGTGQVAGFSLVAGPNTHHAFIDNAGTLTDLGTFGGNESFANALNSNGAVVGYADNASENVIGFLYSNNTLQSLGTLPGGTASQAIDVNNIGNIVGYSTVTSGAQHAFIDRGRGLKDLGTLPGGTNAQALGINDSNEIVGYSDTAGAATRHAFSETDGIMTDLGTLGGNESQAQGINNHGQIVGFSDLANGNSDAFLYSGGHMLDLGTLGGDGSSAFRINGPGEIVGQSEVAGDTDEHAFVYTHNKMVDLNSLIDPASGWDLQAATGINNKGEITGYGTLNGQTHAFTLKLISPTFTSANTTAFTVGDAGSFTVTTNASPAPKLVEIGDLPPGITFVNNGDGTATLAGTPAAGTTGAYPIIIKARNGVKPKVVPQAFTLVINQTPAITSANATTFTVGAAGRFKVTTTGSPVPSVLESGSLPSGITFTDLGNGTAVLKGTPASGSSDVYSLTFKANNGVSPHALQNFTLIVAPAIASPLLEADSALLGFGSDDMLM